jgi:hypothetical protein
MKGKAYYDQPKQKTNDCDKNSYQITHITCSIIKANFNICHLSAHGAGIIHDHIFVKPKG